MINKRAGVEIAERSHSVVLISESPEQTFRIGEAIGNVLKAGDFLALTGELGAGKTVFAQGVARGMGVPDGYAVVSPTFTLINEYPGHNAALYHLDVYRLDGLSDLADTGFDESISQSGVTVVEWSEKIADFIPEDAIFLFFEYQGDTNRKIVVSTKSETVMKKLEEVLL